MLAFVAAFLVGAAAAPAASPTPCPAADLAIVDIRVKLVKRRSAADHYVVTGTVQNRGARQQPVGIAQRVELVRAGAALASETVPALGAGVAYDVAFVLDRPRAERRAPLTVTLRYAAGGVRERNGCAAHGDTLTKTF